MSSWSENTFEQFWITSATLCDYLTIKDLKLQKIYLFVFLHENPRFQPISTTLDPQCTAADRADCLLLPLVRNSNSDFQALKWNQNVSLDHTPHTALYWKVHTSCLKMLMSFITRDLSQWTDTMMSSFNLISTIYSFLMIGSINEDPEWVDIQPLQG